MMTEKQYLESLDGYLDRLQKELDESMLTPRAVVDRLANVNLYIGRAQGAPHVDGQLRMEPDLRHKLTLVQMRLERLIFGTDKPAHEPDWSTLRVVPKSDGLVEVLCRCHGIRGSVRPPAADIQWDEN